MKLMLSGQDCGMITVNVSKNYADVFEKIPVFQSFSFIRSALA